MPSPVQGEDTRWHQFRETDAVIVFVHGVLSSSDSCWFNPTSGAFWPELVSKDEAFSDSSVFLAGYHTGVYSGDYSVADCARELLGNLLRPIDPGGAPLHHQRITLICHSLGGVVARYMLERWREQFKDKAIGLILLASPSLGSLYANRLANVIRLMHHKTGRQLKWTSDDLVDLDRRFRDLVKERLIPGLDGLEAVEHRFPLGPLIIRTWLPPIVDVASGARYFGDVIRVAGTDHFSIAKPDRESHRSHLVVRDFYTNFASSAPAIKRSRPTGMAQTSGLSLRNY
jgi:pimeloyl-ACP methyl ester carboxylesterase